MCNIARPNPLFLRFFSHPSTKKATASKTQSLDFQSRNRDLTSSCWFYLFCLPQGRCQNCENRCAIYGPKWKTAFKWIWSGFSFVPAPAALSHFRAKPKTEPSVSFFYVSICSGEYSFFRSLLRSVRFAPRCISMLQRKDMIYAWHKQIYKFTINLTSSNLYSYILSIVKIFYLL